jgi:thymidylate synthase (FAD)
MEIIRQNNNIFGDGIAFIEEYDFSVANISDESRLNTVTTVASICYQNPKGIGSESLYNRLLAESTGLPSSAFEFIPVLLTRPLYNLVEEMWRENITVSSMSHVYKYGQWISADYILTNLRALINDIGEENVKGNFYNTSEEEIALIKKHFNVYRMKIDLPTRSQIVRHRQNFQELSRRYVSGERVPFEFYISNKMYDLYSITNDVIREDGDYIDAVLKTSDILRICVNHYNAAIKSGVKPQEARRIIPQAAYTTIWVGMQSEGLESMLKLRTDEHTQWEFRQIALQIQEWQNDR